MGLISESKAINIIEKKPNEKENNTCKRKRHEKHYGLTKSWTNFWNDLPRTEQRGVLAYSNIWKRPMLAASQERKLKCIIQNRDSWSSMSVKDTSVNFHMKHPSD